MCPNSLRMCVCEACAGQLPLHTLAIFMFGPEFEGEGGKMGGRRPYHRLPCQKLCLLVSSDPKLVSGTQVAVFDPRRVSNLGRANAKSGDLNP